jgi:hypothetical protein
LRLPNGATRCEQVRHAIFEEIQLETGVQRTFTGRVNIRAGTCYFWLPRISNDSLKRISSDELPTMTWMVPGSTTRCMS